jgi:hypothetical protein
MPRTAIAQIAKLIGQELESRAGPSEQALGYWPHAGGGWRHHRNRRAAVR